MKKLLFIPVVIFFIFFIATGISISNTNADAAPTFVSKWGSGGDIAGQLNSPRAITVDSDGNVYVADSGDHSIKKFDKDGVYLTKWGSYRYTYAPGTFDGLCGLEADSFNNIYVADCGNARQHVQKFSSNGEFLAVIGGIRGTDDGQFLGGGQNDVAVDSANNVYVLDASGNYGVHVFSSNGTFIKRWGPFGSAPLRETYQDNELRNPVGIAIDNQDNVYITDGNREVKKFTKDGVFITKWGIDENGQYLFRNPSGIDVDDDNNVYVVDYSSNDIQVFNSNGVFLFKWGSLGSGDGQFNIPYDTAVYGDYVYVVDAVNHRIQKFARSSSCTEDTFNCSSWGACSANSSQVRTCKKTYDCSIGNSTSPTTSQSCTYIPPTCTSWVYSAWSTCSVDGQQTRTVLSSSPNGCAGGSPITTQSCTYMPPVPETPAPTSNNLALNKPATASNVYRGYGIDVTTPSKANDGDITAYSYWNAGAYPPQWWEVDLLGSYTVEHIELVVGQDPSNIITTHEIWVTYGNGTTSNVHTFSGLTSDYGVLSFAFNPALSGVTKVKIKTTSSQSWVAWREVRIFGSYITSPTCTSSNWSCDGWGACSDNNTKTRVCNKNTNCEGGVSSPSTSQSCKYTPPILTCTADDWSCVDWGACTSTNTQKRNCSKTSNCQGGVLSPATTQSCVYTPACTSFTYSSWSECSVDGKQTRSIVSKYPTNCEGGEAPKITQSCTYTPPCNSDTWQCGKWGSCSPQGIQARSCKRTFDCPSAEDPSPSTSQYCEAPNQPKLQSPTEDLGIVNQDSIVKSTVKLICPVNRTMASQGSGTVVDSRGTILTNKHVIEGTPGCLVGFIDSYGDEPYFGDRQIADIYKVSSDADIAVLKLRNPNNRSITAIDIARGNSNNLRLGDQMTTYGYPAKFGTKITYTSGDFSGVDGSYLKTTAIIEHGNSGGGAYLKNGTFVGIPTAVIKGSLNSMGYVLSINKINGWLNNSVIAYNNDSNNNYSRVSILEDIDLNTLGALNLFIPNGSTTKQATPPTSTKKDTQKILREKTLSSAVASLSVRKAPSAKAKVVWAIKKGKSYVITGAQGDWYRIKINSKLNGWVMKKYVKTKK